MADCRTKLEAATATGEGSIGRRFEACSGGAKVDVQLVTVKNFVCQLQFPSDAGTSRETGWVEVLEWGPVVGGSMDAGEILLGHVQVGAQMGNAGLDLKRQGPTRDKPRLLGQDVGRASRRTPGAA